VENVVATIEAPSSPQPIDLPERKYSFELAPARRDTASPMTIVATMDAAMIAQSNAARRIIPPTDSRLDSSPVGESLFQ
jgi:hypothetical protein